MKVFWSITKLVVLSFGLVAFTVLGGGPTVTVLTPISMPGAGTAEAIVFCADGLRGTGAIVYTVNVPITDLASVNRFVPPNTYVTAPVEIQPSPRIVVPRDRGVLAIPRGPRGTHAMDTNHFTDIDGDDRTCDLLYIGDFAMDQLTIIDADRIPCHDAAKDPAKRCTVATIPKVFRPTDVKFNFFDVPGHPKVGTPLVYVTSYPTDTMFVIDPKTNMIIDIIELPGCLSPNAIVPPVRGGQLAYVACTQSDTIMQVDLRERKVVGIHKLDVGSERLPWDVAAATVGGKITLYTANMSMDTVTSIDGITMARKAHIRIAPGLQTQEPAPRYVATTSDNIFVFVSNVLDQSVSVICARTNKELEKWRVSPGLSNVHTWTLEVHPLNRWLYVTEAWILRVFDISPLYEKYARVGGVCAPE